VSHEAAVVVAAAISKVALVVLVEVVLVRPMLTLLLALEILVAVEAALDIRRLGLYWVAMVVLEL
jgi:hypothetical protein